MQYWEDADPRTIATATQLLKEQHEAVASGKTKSALGAGGPQFSG